MKKLFLVIGILIIIDCSSCRRHRTYEDVEPSLIEQVADKYETSESETLTNDTNRLYWPLLNDSIPQQLLYREIYTTSYNHETKCPNWVAWELTDAKVKGEIDRKVWYDENGNAIGIKNFSPSMVKGEYIFDSEAESPKPDFSDWEFMPEGASHGHMCPAADSKISKAAMNQSFLLTNICVQAEKLNSGSWNKLEMKCREWASQYGRIFIAAGPIFVDGKVSSTMGNNKIAIPDGFFKVVLCMEGKPKAIGFVYANNNEKHKMDEAVLSIDEIEKLTGIDFFPQLPNDIEDEIESQSSLNEW